MPGKFRKMPSPPAGGLRSIPKPSAPRIPTPPRIPVSRPAIPAARPAAPAARPVLPAARPATPAARPVATPPPSGALGRPAAVGGVLRRGSNPQLVQERDARRAAARQQIQSAVGRPAPVVRPPAPPQKSMPRAQTPAQLGGARPRPVITPQGLNKSRPRPGAAAGTSTGGGVVLGALAGAASLAAIRNLAVQVPAAHPSIQADAQALQFSLSQLQSTASFDSIEADLANLDSTLNHVLGLLESARDKGFKYQKDLEQIAYDASTRWQSVRQQASTTLQQEARTLQTTLAPLPNQINSLNSMLGNPSLASSSIRSTQGFINNAMQSAQQARYAIENTYDDIESQVQTLSTRLTQIHWALDTYAQASFKAETGEDLVTVVRCRWDQEGDKDPEGLLYLTNKRLVFERKEQVATKKVLFITLASELVQEVLIDQPVAKIKEFKAINRGLFGHQDFLEVTFEDRKLDVVSLHLNGQASEAWVTLLRRVQSGEIEAERVTAGGISLAELTGPLTTAHLAEIQNEVNELQDELLLKDVQAELENLESEVNSLKRTLTDLRARGYAIEKALEGDVEVLTTQWERVKSNALTVMEQQTGQLKGQMQSIQENLGKLMGLSANLTAARPVYNQVRSLMASAEAQADAAEHSVLTQFDEYDDEVDALAAHLDWIGWMLDALATASFRLLATESGVAAAEAVWVHPSLEPENGILYLTDQRLLWEDRVEIYELKFEVPLAQVLDVKVETDEQGEHQFLVFDLDSGAPLPTARFQLALPVGEDWLKMVGRARTGEYLNDRSQPLTEEELQRIKNAPTQCSNCGAALTAPILRGQTEIACEYCAVVTRL